MAKKKCNTQKAYTPSKKDKRLGFKLDLSRSHRIPWTDKQKTLIDTLTSKQKFTMDEQMLHQDMCLSAIDTKCAFIEGVAGTGKTLVAIYSALKLLEKGSVSRIYYIRSAVESSTNRIGFLKGGIEDKLGVYQAPLDDKLEELLPSDQIKVLFDKGAIQMESTCFLRGRNLADSIVIVDESQNLSHEELVTITSRIAEHSQIWFCYDPKQSDIGNKYKNDMVKFANIFNPNEDFEVKRQGFVQFKFTSDDIVRSKFCKFVMKRLDEHDETQKRLRFEKRNDFDNQKIIQNQPIKHIVGEEWSPSR